MCVVWHASGVVSFVSSVGSFELEIGNGGLPTGLIRLPLEGPQEQEP